MVFASCKNDFLCTLRLLTEEKHPQNVDAEWRSDDFHKNQTNVLNNDGVMARLVKERTC